MATDGTSNQRSEKTDLNLIKRYFNTLEQWKDMELWTAADTSKDQPSGSSNIAKKRKHSGGEESGAKKKMKGSISGARPWDRNAFVQRLSTFSISRYVIQTFALLLGVANILSVFVNLHPVGSGSPAPFVPWNVQRTAGPAAG